MSRKKNDIIAYSVDIKNTREYYEWIYDNSFPKPAITNSHKLGGNLLYHCFGGLL